MTIRSDGLRLALGTLTRFPVAPPTRVNPQVAEHSLALAPGVGLVLGVLVAVPSSIPALSMAAPMLSGVLAVVLSAALTGGLHLDGLADTADGFGAAAKGRDTDTVLEVMRGGDIGPLGVVSLILVIGVQAAAVASLPAALNTAGPAIGAVIVTAMIASRTVLAVLCRVHVPAARQGGLGYAVAGSVRPGTLLATMLGALVVMSALTYSCGVAWWLAAVQLCTTVVVAQWLQRRAQRALGGITGDVLGAAVELGLAAALVVTVLVAVSVPGVLG